MNRIKRAVHFCVIMAVIMALLSACGKAQEKEEIDSWGPQVENLQWGMSKEQIQELYPCTEEEGTNGLKRLILNDSIKLCGVPADVVLTLDDSFGLIRVTALAKEADYEKLENVIQKKLADYRTGAQPNNGASWKSGIVMEGYGKDELRDAYAKIFGEGVIEDIYIDGMLLSPLVFYELKKRDGGCRLIIDATVKEEMAYIFA